MERKGTEVERRKQRRYKKGISAVCEVNGARFKARTYDISEEGITLLVGPEMPKATSYLVRCWLPSGTEAVFEVEERQRRVLSRGNRRFHRLGLKVINESLDIIIFFRELAELLFKEDEKQREPTPRRRLRFQLPVIVETEEGSYRCQTLDMGSWGLAVEAPVNFPTLERYRLVCIDPDGGDVPVTAVEKNRSVAPEGGLRIGFQVIDGSEGFRGFVEKYAKW